MVDEYFSPETLKKLAYIDGSNPNPDTAGCCFLALVLEQHGHDEVAAREAYSAILRRAAEEAEKAYQEKAGHFGTPAIEGALKCFNGDAIKALIALDQAVEYEEKVREKVLREGFEPYIDRMIESSPSTRH